MKHCVAYFLHFHGPLICHEKECLFYLYQVSYHFSGNNWPFGAVACGFTTVAFHCSMQCSVLITCAIAIERYLGVVHPIKAKHWCKPWRAGLVCLFIWGVVLAVQTPLMRHDLTLRVEQLNLTTCFDVIPRHTFSTRAHTYMYFGSVFLLSYALPLIVLLVCYVAVTLELRRSPQTDGEDHSRRYAMIVCTIAAVSFIVFYLPNVVLQILHLLYRTQKRSLYPYYKLTHGINSLNCCVDPFVYYLASREFRKAFRKTLQPLQCCEQCDSEEFSTPSEMASLGKATMCSSKL